MIPAAGSPAWAGEQARWGNYFAESLSAQVTRITALVTAKKSRLEDLEGHFDTIQAIFRRGVAQPDPQIHRKLLILVRELHPLPELWGRWSEWRRVLQSAAGLAHSLGDTQAETWMLLTQAEMFMSAGFAGQVADLVGQASNLTNDPIFADLQMQAEILDYRARLFLGKIDNQLATLDLLLQSLSQKAPLLDPLACHRFDASLRLIKGDLLRRQGLLDDALTVTEFVLESTRRLDPKNRDLLAETYTLRSSVHWSGSDWEAAIADLKIATHLYKAVGNRSAQVITYSDRGLVYWSAGQYAAAGRDLRKGIQLAEQLKMVARHTIMIGDLGLVSLSIGKLQQAVALMKHHYEMAELTGSVAERMRAASNLAKVYVCLGRFEEARDLSEKAFEHWIRRNLPVARGVEAANLAWAYQGLGDRQKALEYAQKSLAVAVENNLPAVRLVALRCLLELQGDPAEKSRLAQEALTLARQRGRRLNEAAILLSLADYGDDGENLRAQAIAILQEIGALEWLKVKPVFKPLRLVLML